MVLTPHPGEMARLAGMTVKEVEADRIGLARRFATSTADAGAEGMADAHRASGWAHRGEYQRQSGDGEGRQRRHPDGDCGGDAGAVSGQRGGGGGGGGVSAWAGGGLCAQAMDEHTVLATDTVAHLSDAFRYRATDGDGMTWVCGLSGGGRI
jgi:hypothetical protein